MRTKGNEAEKFIIETLKNRNQKLLAIYIHPDHAPILAGLNNLYLKIVELVRDIKSGKRGRSFKA